MKIAINSCFGGFSLSARATARYYELKGKSCTFRVTRYSNMIREKFEVPSWKQVEDDDFFIVKDGDEFYLDSDVKRDDPTLIQVIEELGNLCNTQHSEIKIVEIPDNVEWYIEEYDGMEHVAEKHHTWY